MPTRGRVRRLALELCERLETGYAAKTIPALVDDPEFREDAVEAALAAGQQLLDEGDSETARRSQFARAFDHVRESGQVVAPRANSPRLASTSISPSIWGWSSTGG